MSSTTGAAGREQTVPVWIPQTTGEQRTVAAVGLGRLPENTVVPRVSISVPRGQEPPEVQVTRPGPSQLLLEVAVPLDARVRLDVLLPTQDAVALWRPGSGSAVADIPPSWADAEEVSPLAGLALGALVGPADAAVLTYGADAGDHRLTMRAGLVEETADFLLSVDLRIGDLLSDGRRVAAEPDAGGATNPGGRLRVLLDLSGDHLALAVPRTSAALADTARGERTGVSSGVSSGEPAGPRIAARARRPVLCSWYALHLDITQERLADLGRRGAELGFGTLIVDDGWQTGETVRGYASCGDWQPDARKLSDPAGLVAGLAGLGMDVLWWIGTPWIGHRSRAAAEEPALLADDPALEAGILDPRSRRARTQLVDRLVQLLRSTGAQGFKLDFLERFATAGGPPPHDADEVDAETAALRLLRELTRRAAQVRPDLLIEHREPYVGPAASRTATMLRVADCPMSPARNRLGIINLRLGAPGVAIHSDPVMWAPADSPQRVAQHLLNALFGVPQVSVDLAALPPEHLGVLRHWISFWNAHADLLLHGRFHPQHFEQGFPVVTAEDEETAITVRYAPAVVSVPDGPWTTWHLLNAGEGSTAVRDLSPDVRVDEILGASGNVVAHRSRLPFLDIPTGGMATLSRGSASGRTGHQVRGTP